MAAPAFETEVAEVEGLPEAVAVRLRGRITVGDVRRLREELLGAMTTTRARSVVLELGRVERIDTAGAAVLFEAWSAGRRRGLRVLLCSPSESVLSTFRLAGLDDVLGACCPGPAETRRRLLA